MMWWEMIKNHPYALKLKNTILDWKYKCSHLDTLYVFLSASIGLLTIGVIALLLLGNRPSEKYIVLDPGQKFVDADFRHYDLYITSKPMSPNDTPEEYTIVSEDKNFVYHVKELR